MFCGDLEGEGQIDIDEAHGDGGVRRECSPDLRQRGLAALQQSAHGIAHFPVHGPGRDEIRSMGGPNEGGSLGLAYEDGYQG